MDILSRFFNYLSSYWYRSPERSECELNVLNQNASAIKVEEVPPQIYYNLYIDEALTLIQDNKFIIKSFITYNRLLNFSFFSLTKEELDKQLTVLYLEKSDTGYKIIVNSVYYYDYNREENIIYGNDELILLYFNHKPLFLPQNISIYR